MFDQCINFCSGSYCPGGPDSDFEYSTQSYTGYEVRFILPQCLNMCSALLWKMCLCLCKSITLIYYVCYCGSSRTTRVFTVIVAFTVSSTKSYFRSNIVFWGFDLTFMMWFLIFFLIFPSDSQRPWERSEHVMTPTFRPDIVWSRSVEPCTVPPSICWIFTHLPLWNLKFSLYTVTRCTCC